MTIYKTLEEALNHEMFALDAGWLPFMLCERLDGGFVWVGLGNYQGRNRGPMTQKERQEAIESAPLIGSWDLEQGKKVCDYKRAIKIVDHRGDIQKQAELFIKQGWVLYQQHDGEMKQA